MNRSVLLALIAVAPLAHAQPIPIVNPGFETPLQTACTFRNFVFATDGWENLGSNSGLWRPGTCWDLTAPQGVQVAYSNGGSSRQILTTSALPNTTYTLSAMIGTRNNPCCPAQAVRLELWAGETKFGTLELLKTQVPPIGQWARYTLVATTSGAVLATDKLQIRFFSAGVQADFDDFTLHQGGSTCPADLNGDSIVDDSDFILFAIAYNILDCADPAMPPGCLSDINGDGLVDDSDFSSFVVAYNNLLCPE